jgi:hypothetical protein
MSNRLLTRIGELSESCHTNMSHLLAIMAQQPSASSLRRFLS